MTDSKREELVLGEGHEAWRGDGILEVVFRGVVTAKPMQICGDAALAFGVEHGLGAPRSIMLVDIRALESFTPEARKIFGTLKPPTVGVPMHADVIVVGATIKTKALFTLVLTAARLLGDVRFDVHYVPDIEDGRKLAVARRDDHRAHGRMKPAKTTTGS
jgi:hypothetical protein